MKKILIACEESQAVCNAFRDLGHEAYSCDILECSGNHPEWHIKGDVLEIIEGNCSPKLQDGNITIVDNWDLIIAHPPCTYLTVTGNRWFNVEKYGDKARKRHKDREEAIKFFMKLAHAKCDKIVIENPVGVMSSYWRKSDQIIQPFEFGHYEAKKTALWIKGLPKLKPTKIVEPEYIEYASGKRMAKWYADAWKLPKEERTKLFSHI